MSLMSLSSYRSSLDMHDQSAPCGAGGAHNARPERRRRPRALLHWRVDFLASPAGIIRCVTRDLSSNGFFCKSPLQFVPGERVICFLTAPAYHPVNSDSILHIECRVRIVRVQPGDYDEFVGVGCEIEDYQVLST